MEDSTAGNTGNGGNGDGNAPPHALKCKRAALWRAYVSDPAARTVRGLAKVGKCRTAMAQQAIQTGWPEYEWPAFRDLDIEGAKASVVREAAEDAARAIPAEMRPAIVDAVVKTFKDWETYRDMGLSLRAQFQEVAAPVMRALHEAAAELDAKAFKRTVVIRDKAAGTEEVIEVKDGPGVVKSLQQFAAALKENDVAASLLAGKPTERTEQTYPEPTADELALLDAGHWPEAWPLARRDAYVARLEKSTPTVH